jgi:hypothetical protein
MKIIIVAPPLFVYARKEAAAFASATRGASLGTISCPAFICTEILKTTKHLIYKGEKI